MKSPKRKNGSKAVVSNESPPSSGRPWGFCISNLLYLALGMGMMTLLGIFTPALRSRGGSEPSGNLLKKSAHAQQGPWGELEYSDFTLEQPDDYLPDSRERMPKALWHFPNLTPGQLTALFQSLDVSSSIRAMLLDTHRWQVMKDGVLVEPTPALLLGLGRPARQRLYSVLSQSPLNFPQYHPFRFRADAFSEWFANSQLPPAKLQMVRDLTYTNGSGAICLVDIDVLQDQLTPDEFRRLFVSLYSEPTLVMSLRVKPSSDVNALAQYWGRGGRERAILPMLKSVAKRPEGGSINIEQLLPPFARLRLYTFTEASTNAADKGQDCFWTALNFFNNEPSPPYLDTRRSLAALLESCAETREPPRFGDVLVFRQRHEAMHACVYIADEVVFTKNGVNYHQPWVLMKMRDLLARYSTDQPISVVVLRPKHF